MSHISPDFKTKKAFKEAVKAYNDHKALASNKIGTVGHLLATKQDPPEPIKVYQPGGIFPQKQDGIAYIEGPAEYHKWYAKVEMKDGLVTKVLS